MTRPRFQPRFSVLVAIAAVWASAPGVRAEQPPGMSPPPVAVKTAPPPRARPQVIYHLPRSSNYAATLHSQAKTPSHPLPIDSSMPLSLQMSRAAANEAAARAQQEQQTQQRMQQQQQQQAAPKANTLRQQRVKRPKLHSNPPQMRKHHPGKGRGPGGSHGKGRKK